jgi:hypothetical protein
VRARIAVLLGRRTAGRCDLPLEETLGGVEHPRHVADHARSRAQTRANAGTCSRRHWHSDDARRRRRCAGDSGSAVSASPGIPRTRYFAGERLCRPGEAGLHRSRARGSRELPRRCALPSCADKRARRGSWGRGNRRPLGHGRSLFRGGLRRRRTTHVPEATGAALVFHAPLHNRVW